MARYNFVLSHDVRGTRLVYSSNFLIQLFDQHVRYNQTVVRSGKNECESDQKYSQLVYQNINIVDYKLQTLRTLTYIFFLPSKPQTFSAHIMACNSFCLLFFLRQTKRWRISEYIGYLRIYFGTLTSSTLFV